MSQQERERLIKFIRENDNAYNYNGVDFKYYTNADLRILKKRIEREIKEKHRLAPTRNGMYQFAAG